MRERLEPVVWTRTALRDQVWTAMSPECALSSSRCPRWTAKVVSISGASSVAARARTSNTGGSFSAPGRDDGRGLAEQVDLATHGPGKMGVQVRVAGVGCECPAGVRDGSVDEREIPLDDAHRGGVQRAAALLHHALQISHGRIILPLRS